MQFEGIILPALYEVHEISGVSQTYSAGGRSDVVARCQHYRNLLVLNKRDNVVSLKAADSSSSSRSSGDAYDEVTADDAGTQV